MYALKGKSQGEKEEEETKKGRKENCERLLLTKQATEGGCMNSKGSRMEKKETETKKKLAAASASSKELHHDEF